MEYQGTTSRNRLSDRDMLFDLLITEKHLSRLYDQGVLEAVSPMLANTFERLQADTHDNARTIFNAMQARGWYNPEQGQKKERMLKQRKPITQTFDVAVDSKYAVTSGSRRFGRRLANGQRLGKSGVYSSKNTEISSREWQ
jgi:hypothetical protein